MKAGFGTPYWWDGAVPLPQLLARPPKKTDFLIVGAGFTGLTAALTLAGEGAKVTVVDAGNPGEGASSRNGGMAGAHPRLSLAAMSEKFGSETAKGMFNEANPAFDHLRQLIKTHEIDCDYQETGRIQLAWTKADFAAQRALADDMNANTEFSVEVVPREDIQKHVKTDQYFGGLLFRNHGAVHPKKLVDGLINAALKAGVQIVPSCPIDHIGKVSAGFDAVSKSGNIRAGKVILATNGYTQGSGVFRWLSRRVFPMPSYLIATEPLPGDLIAELAPAGRMMVETRARHSYWRVSPDGSRIIWGGRASIKQIDPLKASVRLRETMAQIWPALQDIKLSHAWSGNTGFSFGHAPKVGSHSGMHYALGYCGGGVVLAPYLGMKAAFQALGDTRGETAYSRTEFKTKTYYFGKSPWFLKPADFWYSNVVDRAQNATAAKDHQSGD